MILSVFMRNSVLKNISRRGYKRRTFLFQGRITLKNCWRLIVPTQPARHHWQPDFKIITEYAVESRYPGDSATADNTQHAMHICDEVRQAVRTQLKLN